MPASNLAKKRLQVVIILMLLLRSMFAQPYSAIKFNHYTVYNGLTDNYCESVIQDSYGFIWIATNDGLCRYDGYTFKSYKFSETDTNTIGSNYLFILHEDIDTILWVGTNMGGLARYDRVNDKFIRVTFDAENDVWHQRNRINEIAEYNGMLWIATMYGMAMYNKYSDSVEWYIPTFEEKEVNVHHQITSILPDEEGNLWVGTLMGGLYYFDINKKMFTKQFQHVEDNRNSLSNDRIKRIYRTKNGRIWIATEEGGLNLFNPISEEFYSYRHNESDPNSIGSDDVYSLFEDSQGRFWVGTINGGLNLFDQDKGVFVKFVPSRNNPKSINSPSITSIFEDTFGNLWFTTHGGGLNQLNPRENTILHLHSEIEACRELQHNYVSCVFEDENGLVWIGTDGGGLHLFNPQSYTLKHIRPKHDFESKALLDICSAGNDKLWISAWAGGVSLYNKTTNTVEKTYLNRDLKNSIGANNIKSILNDDSLLWVVTHGDGLNILEEKSGKYYNWRNNDIVNFNLFVPEWGNEIIKDSKKRLWITTNVGLYMFDGEEFHTFLQDTSNDCSIQGYISITVFEDSRRRIWIGTEDGLSLYMESSGCFKKIYGSPRKIKSIIEDLNGDIWMGTNNGLVRYSPSLNKFRKFSMLDGLQGNQFFERSVASLSNGKLIFGGLNGFNIFHPDSIYNKSFSTKIVFTKLKVQNLSDFAGEIEVPITFKRNVTIGYGQTVLTIEYTGIGLVSPQENMYRFMLEGFDNDWRDETSERKATYTNLDPGTYKFKVKATNSQGEWVDKPVSITLTVLPPWWKKTEYRISALIVFLLIMFVSYRYRMFKIKRQNKLLERDVRERTKELHAVNYELQIRSDKISTQNAQLKAAKEEIEEQNNLLEHQKKELEFKNKELNEHIRTKDKFMSIIAHDIKNPINSLIGFSELTYLNYKKYNDEKLGKFLELINRSAKNLFNLVNNLLEWAMSQSGNIEVYAEVFNMNELIDQNVRLVQVMLKSKKIRLNYTQEEDFNVFADLSMINTVVRNLLNNAIKFTPENGEITINCSEEIKGFITCEISDNGVGMSQEKVGNLFRLDAQNSTKGTNNEAGTGLGLLLCKEFIAKNKGKIFVSSKEGAGTTFSILLPKAN